MKPERCKTTKSTETAEVEILSPPRIGRFQQQKTAQNIDSIFGGKRSDRDNTTRVNDCVVLKKRIIESENSSKAMPSSGNFTPSPITPSFILSNQVSPTSPSRGRLQSNRGRSKRADASIPIIAQCSFPVSKRGRGRNVSARGRVSKPRKLDIENQI